MQMTLIVAASENGVIGRDGDLPWRLPADLAHFKQVTMGKPVVMGRKTWESIGRPLPGRTNIVLSRQPGYEAKGCRVVGSLGEAILIGSAEGAEELMVIGGEALYAETLPVADRILLTRVHAVLDGDTHFPALDQDAWTVTAVERHEADERNDYAYSFLELTRIC
jgi:dihydrofolate reductase